MSAEVSPLDQARTLLDGVSAAMPGEGKRDLATLIALAYGMALADAFWPLPVPKMAITTAGLMIGAAIGSRQEELAAELRSCAGQA